METKYFILHNGLSTLQMLTRIHKVEIYWNEYKSVYHIMFTDTAIKDGSTLLYDFGCGNTIEEAACDYLKRIKNKTLKNGNREEFTVLV